MLALLYQLWIKWKIYISLTEYFQYDHMCTHKNILCSMSQLKKLCLSSLSFGSCMVPLSSPYQLLLFFPSVNMDSQVLPKNWAIYKSLSKWLKCKFFHLEFWNNFKLQEDCKNSIRSHLHWGWPVVNVLPHLLHSL